jgi:hypothetical protein
MHDIKSFTNTFGTIAQSPDPEESDVEIMYCSRVFHRSDGALIEVLVSALLKMVYSPRISEKGFKRCSGESGRKYGKVELGGGKSFLYEALPCNEEFGIQYAMPSAQSLYCYLLVDFYGGRDGRVWLGCNASGHLTVIKLSTDRCYETEAAVWKDVWGVAEVRTTVILDAQALLMPFAFHGVRVGSRVRFNSFAQWDGEEELTVIVILESEALNKFDEEQLRSYYDDPLRCAEEAIREMACKGYRHGDLWWRHVALLPVAPASTPSASGADTSEQGKWTVRPILIDLHDVEKLTDVDKIEDVVKHSMDILAAELRVAIV